MHRERGLMYRDYHDGPWFPMARVGFLLLALGLFAFAGWYLFRTLRRPATGTRASHATGSPGTPVSAVQPTVGQPVVPAEDGAVALLRMRYARGEVNREEFLRTAADLGVRLPDNATLPPTE